MVENNKELAHSVEFRSILNSYVLLSSLIAFHKLNLFEDAKERKVDVEQYCTKSKIKIDRLLPIVRILNKYGFLSIDNGSVKLTSKGEEFCDPDNSWLSLLTLTAEDYLPASLKIYDSFFFEETAYELSHRTDPWSKRAYAKVGEVFDAWLDSETYKSAEEISHYLEDHDLLIDSFLDIGGGMGSVTQQIKKIRPDMYVALYELPEVITRAKQRHIDTSNFILDLYISGNFFDHIPSDFDLYFLKSILHDFNDDLALQILKNLKESKSPNSKICIVERSFDENNVSINTEIDEFNIAELNFLMSIVHGSKERNDFEWNQLFKSANLSIISKAELQNGYSVFELA